MKFTTSTKITDKQTAIDYLYYVADLLESNKDFIQQLRTLDKNRMNSFFHDIDQIRWDIASKAQQLEILKDFPDESNESFRMNFSMYLREMHNIEHLSEEYDIESKISEYEDVYNYCDYVIELLTKNSSLIEFLKRVDKFQKTPKSRDMASGMTRLSKRLIDQMKFIKKVTKV